LEFEFLRKLIESRSGLVLPAGERLRLEGRLHQLARRTGLGSLVALVARLRQPLAEPLIAQVVEAMAVRETWFFRDKAPFDAFAGHVIPQLLNARPQYRSREMRVPLVSVHLPELGAQHRKRAKGRYKPPQDCAENAPGRHEAS